MSAHQEEKTIKVTTQDLERERDRIDQINAIYGDKKQGCRHRHPNIFIYSTDNIDNDDIIARVDATPTCKRTKEDLNQLKNEYAE